MKDCRRGPYKNYPLKVKASIAKYAAIHGVASALYCHVRGFPALKESTVRTWRNLYSAELKKHEQLNDDDSEYTEHLLEKREVLHCS